MIHFELLDSAMISNAGYPKTLIDPLKPNLQITFLHLLIAHCTSLIPSWRLLIVPRSDSSRSRKLTRETGDERSSRFRSSSPDVSPTDRRQMSGFGNHRKALAVLGAGDASSSTSSRSQGPASDTASNHQEPVAWSSSPTIPPSAGPGTFFNDSSEYDLSPASPLFRPGTSRTAASDSGELTYDGDHRRPSVASATTVSSQGSRSSHSGSKFRKRLQGFFGDEFNGNSDSRQDPDSNSLLNSGAGSARGRNNSVSSRHTSERAVSPLRPHTPLPSSEVTPWMYQRFNVSQMILNPPSLSLFS